MRWCIRITVTAPRLIGALAGQCFLQLILPAQTDKGGMGIHLRPSGEKGTSLCVGVLFSAEISGLYEVGQDCVSLPLKETERRGKKLVAV